MKFSCSIGWIMFLVNLFCHYIFVATTDVVIAILVDIIGFVIGTQCLGKGEEKNEQNGYSRAGGQAADWYFSLTRVLIQ